MSKKITSIKQYQGLFKEKDDNNNRSCKTLSISGKALECALDIRKFEIDLYWKRAGYFWTLIAVTFTGYFGLAASEQASKHPRLSFLICCIGLVLSIAWYFVNWGSKYWQENWEQHVDLLEDEHMGPLYKMTNAHEKYRFWDLCAGYPFSVSKVNQLVSLFVVCIWAGLFVYSFPHYKIETFLCQEWKISFLFKSGLCWIPMIVTVITGFSLFYWGRTHQPKEKSNEIAMTLRETGE
jgi:amino acid transporter